MSNVTSAAAERTTARPTENGKEPPEPYQDAYWVFAETVICFVTVFAIYILICLARYATITRCKPGREIGGKKGKVLYRMCLVSVAMAVCRFVADQAVAVTGWKNDENCIVSVAVSTVFYSLSLYPVYIFLWLRQSIFYANPVLSHVLNPVVTFISYLTLFVMLSGGAVLTVIYVIPEMTGWDYRASSDGCRDVNTKSGFDLVPTLVVCFTVSFQLSLLALFVYPLLSKKTQRYRSANSKSTSSPSEGSLETYGNGNAHYEDPEAACCEPHQQGQRHNETRPHKSKMSLLKKPLVLCRKSERRANVKTVSTRDLNTASEAKRGRRSSAGSNGIDGKKFKRSRTQQGRRVILFIRKAFILTLICVLSDVAFTVVQMLIVVPELVYLAVFDINLLINVICIIMSFRDWPNMILPLCAWRFRKNRPKCVTNSAVGPRGNNTTRLIITMAQSRIGERNRVAVYSMSTPVDEDSSGSSRETRKT